MGLVTSAGFDSGLSVLLQEYQSFTDLVYNKGRVVSAIDWLPNRKGIVAVAAAEPATFAERVETSGRVHTSAVLVWNFTDPIHPQVRQNYTLLTSAVCFVELFHASMEVL